MTAENTPDGVIYYYREPNDALIARKQDTTCRYYHFDELGSTAILTNQSGETTDRYTYDPWGNLLTHTGATNQPYQYVGQLGYYTHYMDPVFKLLQLGVRFYDIEIGRFMQQDPIDYGVNLYEYAGGNAMVYVDPVGLLLCIPDEVFRPRNYGFQWVADFYTGQTVSHTPNLPLPHIPCWLDRPWTERFGICSLICVGPAAAGAATIGTAGLAVGTVVPGIGNGVGAGAGMAVGFFSVGGACMYSCMMDGPEITYARSEGLPETDYDENLFPPRYRPTPPSNKPNYPPYLKGAPRVPQPPPKLGR